MDTAVNVGKQIFDKYNALVLQPGMLVNPAIFTFTKENMLFVIESGGAGLMGHTHELYEVEHEHEKAIISFKMAHTQLHGHDQTYFIAKHENAYMICASRNDQLINMSSTHVLHSHLLKIREIFKDSVRIFSDYRDIQVISNRKYTFEIQIDEGVGIEHIHDIHQIEIPKKKMYRNAVVAFIFKENIFHGHEGVFYIEKENGDFVIKCNRRIMDKTTPDSRLKTHTHNIKLIRVTKRDNKKIVLLEEPVPNHVAHEAYQVARILLQLT